MLLVHLLKSGTSNEDLALAESWLFVFVKQCLEFYDKCFLTLNMHKLVRVTDSVRELGPLYTHSYFSFETKYCVLLEMIRRSQNIENQIISALSFVQKIPELQSKCIMCTEARILCDNMCDSEYVKKGRQIADNMYMLGSVRERSVNRDEFNVLKTFMPLLCDTVTAFDRICLKGVRIYSTEYTRMNKRNNSAVLLQNTETRFGLIQFFAEIDDVIVVVIEKLHAYDIATKLR